MIEEAFTIFYTAQGEPTKWIRLCIRYSGKFQLSQRPKKGTAPQGQSVAIVEGIIFHCFLNWSTVAIHLLTNDTTTCCYLNIPSKLCGFYQNFCQFVSHCWCLAWSWELPPLNHAQPLFLIWFPGYTIGNPMMDQLFRIHIRQCKAIEETIWLWVNGYIYIYTYINTILGEMNLQKSHWISWKPLESNGWPITKAPATGASQVRRFSLRSCPPESCFLWIWIYRWYTGDIQVIYRWYTGDIPLKLQKSKGHPCL